MTDPLYGGLIRLHLLHHASARPFYGLAMIEQLARHGYRLSPGTLYPILHGLEKKGYLRSTERRLGRTARRMYRITPSGRRALEGAKQKVYELLGEMFFDGSKP
jgi:DNA-binding PadR family transcriptional regulator